MEFFWHMMRWEGFEHLAVTGKIEERKEEEERDMDIWRLFEHTGKFRR